MEEFQFLSDEKMRFKFMTAMSAETNEVKRKATFMAMLGKEFTKMGVPLPVIVGGMAVELFTFGKYTSDDIDIKSDQGKTFYLLTKLGFSRQGKQVWYSEDFNIIIDWLGADFEQGKELRDRVLHIRTENGPVAVIPIEELVTDRLCAAKFWNHKPSLMWAKHIYEAAETQGIQLDRDFLRDRLEAEDVLDLFEEQIDPSFGVSNAPGY